MQTRASAFSNALSRNQSFFISQFYLFDVGLFFQFGRGGHRAMSFHTDTSLAY